MEATLHSLARPCRLCRSFSLRSILLAALLSSGCAADRSGAGTASGEVAWSGMERDSAGVQIVANPVQGLWTEVTRWTIEADLVIGVAEGPEEYQFGHIADVDHGDDGRIYVLDQQAGMVLVYDADGTYAFTFGRPGRGPGELSNNIPLGADAIDREAGGELLISDRQNNRVSRFAPDGAFLGSFSLRLEGGLPGAVAVLVDGHYAFQRSAAAWSGVLRVDEAGAVVDTILTFPDRATPPVSEGRTPALTHAGIWTALPDGSVAAGFSDRFRIEIRAPDGRLTRVITREAEAAPLSAREQERFLERLLHLWREMFRARGESESWIESQLREGRNIYALPEYAPAFTALAAGPEGTLWVQRALPVDSMTGAILQGFPIRAFAGPEWEVYSREGRFLGVVTMTSGFALLKIRDGYVYGRQRGEYDVERMGRLRVRVP